MIQISHGTLITIAVAAIPIFSGFIFWLVNVSISLGSIKATMEGQLERHGKEIEILKKNAVEHDRRIQRLEDSRPSVNSRT